MSNSDERMFGMLIYLLSFFTTVIGPLIIWLLKREESSFVDFHGKEYFNFFISYAIYGIITLLLMFVLIGFLLAPIVGIAGFVFTIIGAVKAFNGEEYRFPLIIRIIK
ncbi:DUF4870 domain-containing protein [Gracilibacillus sp. S3-1-1]|uniref:DUF4870 domain-containing protein n=1 Tax=Gracilibacillus pellucidus TaxID=3095368 RepID=A0ACC6M4H3_9BACI|nr:DUF4870 domain-containing protein [Gracilibacillus sp. S3-1-1]MDX8045870.1 DUF4870 domain-containing protein [Gracilibacillus sp. S3-1-1]